MFLKFKAEVKNQLNRKIKRFRSDWRGEHNTKTLEDFCEKNGIIHEFSAPYTPQKNGVAERKNRTLKEINSMFLSSVYLIICGEEQSCLHAIFLIESRIRS